MLDAIELISRATMTLLKFLHQSHSCDRECGDIEILTRTSSLKLKNMIGMVGSNEYSFSRSGSSCVLEIIAMYIFVPGTGSTVPPTVKTFIVHVA